MDFNDTKSIKSPEDLFSKLDLCTISLHKYEWEIYNIAMLNPFSKDVVSPAFSVGPCKNFDLKILLSAVGYDRIRIEVRLIKECRLTDEMKSKEKNCPLTSKLKKHMLRLELLDHDGNITHCYKNMTYEFKLINTTVVYAWTKEENVSRFIHNDCITIRAKLSMRFYSDSSEMPTFYGNDSIRIFIKDMIKFYNERNCCPDLLINVGNQYVPCHKSIICSQYPYFIERTRTDASVCSDTKYASSSNIPSHVHSLINNNCEIFQILNTDTDVFLAVLHFIYTKQLQLFHAVDDFDVYECAKRYAIRDLVMLLKPKEIKVHSKIIVKELNYTWYVNNYTSVQNNLTSVQSSEFKTEVGSEVVNWKVMLSHVDSNNIHLDFIKINGQKADVHAIFKVEVYNASGSIFDKREFRYLFTSGTFENCLPGVIEAASPFLVTPDILYNDTLAISCDLKLSCNELSSDIKYHYSNEHPVIDLSYWVNNFQKLFDSEDFSDFILIVEEKEFRVHKAILAARSPVFARMFVSDMEEKRSGCVRIEDASSAVIEKALHYIYACKIDDLTITHACALYYIADKYALMDLKSKCCEFLAQNLSNENVCEVLIMADLYVDEKLKAAAKKTICHNASQTLLSPNGS